MSGYLDFEECLGVDPLPQFALKVLALVDEDLAVVGQHDARALERTWRRPFEVDTGQTEAAAVARTLELALRRQVVWRAAEMGARADQHVEAAGVLVDIVDGPD